MTREPLRFLPLPANAVRCEAPLLVYVVDAPAEDIKLAWTDEDGAFHTRDIGLQKAALLVEDLGRAINRRIGGGR